MTGSISWVVLRTVPIARIEFRVEHRITQNEFPAMLPYEIVYEKKPGKKEPIKRKYALFPRYVFAGLQNIDADFDRLRNGNPKLGIPGIPEIHGIVSRSRDQWSPLVLRPADVVFISQVVARADWGMTEVDLHKGLKPGKTIEVSLGGGVVQTTKIDAVTKKGVKALLSMLGSMHVVEVPFEKVRAA
jgi:hypothetical protein